MIASVGVAVREVVCLQHTHSQLRFGGEISHLARHEQNARKLKRGNISILNVLQDISNERSDSTVPLRLLPTQTNVQRISHALTERPLPIEENRHVRTLVRIK